LTLYERIIGEERQPVIVIENKVDYTRLFGEIDIPLFMNYACAMSPSAYPALRLHPKMTEPDVTIICYGGMVQEALLAAEILFSRSDILAEIVVLTQVHPLPLEDLREAIHTPYLFPLEEGSVSAGFGSETLSALLEAGQPVTKAVRIASRPLPIPSSKELEEQVLCQSRHIADIVRGVFHGH
jgi:2-oxoisovalerate dehydrogenase E1 component